MSFLPLPLALAGLILALTPASAETYLVSKVSSTRAFADLLPALLGGNPRWHAKLSPEAFEDPHAFSNRLNADGVVWLALETGHLRLRFYRRATGRVVEVNLGPMRGLLGELREATALQLSWLLDAPAGAGRRWRPPPRVLPPVQRLPQAVLKDLRLRPPRARPKREPPVVPLPPPALSAPAPVGTQVEVEIERPRPDQ